jgi:hypothetical protein
MGWFSRREPTAARQYPAAGTTVTGSASRFRRSKTSGARQAGAAAEAWEQQDRARDKRGGWRRTTW